MTKEEYLKLIIHEIQGINNSFYNNMIKNQCEPLERYEEFLREAENETEDLLNTIRYILEKEFNVN